MPPIIAVRALRTLLSSPHVVHFMPMQATPSPAIDTIMPTIISARVAWREPNTRTHTRTHTIHITIIQAKQQQILYH